MRGGRGGTSLQTESRFTRKEEFVKTLMLGAGAVGTVSALKFMQEAMLEQLVIADAVSARASLLADRLNDPRVSAIQLDAGDRAAVARTIRDNRQYHRPERGFARHQSRGDARLPGCGVRLHRPGQRRAPTPTGSPSWRTSSRSTRSSGPPDGSPSWVWEPIPAPPTSTPPTPRSICWTTITEIRVRDGDNSVCQGHDGFVAAFSPWVFIDECLCKAVSWRDGRYHLEEPLTGFEPFDFPELGILNCYYVDHEESKTLPRFFPQARTVDFKLCMDDVTVETLRVMKRLGLSGKKAGPSGRRVDRAARPGRLPAAPAEGPGRADARARPASAPW